MEVSLFCDRLATSLTAGNTRCGTLASRQFFPGCGKRRVADATVLASTLPSLLHVLQNPEQFLGGGEVPGDTCILEQVFHPITQAAPERAVQTVHHSARVVERNRALRIRRLELRVRYDWQESPKD